MCTCYRKYSIRKEKYWATYYAYYYRVIKDLVKINSDTVRHLASHTQFIREIDEYDNVIPSKVMTTFADTFCGIDHVRIGFGKTPVEHEPIVDSVIREVREETGLMIEKPQLCGIKEWINEDGSRYVVFLFRADHFSGELAIRFW